MPRVSFLPFIFSMKSCSGSLSTFPFLSCVCVREREREREGERERGRASTFTKTNSSKPIACRLFPLLWLSLYLCRAPFFQALCLYHGYLPSLFFSQYQLKAGYRHLGDHARHCSYNYRPCLPLLLLTDKSMFIANNIQYSIWSERPISCRNRRKSKCNYILLV